MQKEGLGSVDDEDSRPMAIFDYTSLLSVPISDQYIRFGKGPANTGSAAAAAACKIPQVLFFSLDI